LGIDVTDQHITGSFF